ncbi:hypothetical protein ACT3SP_10310 [Brachybacterium sp. AOP43-C2-M15]|uniref:hypothetical protein n=1 Tax=Brachybacterium sp. AOP43-C2-M15 TaxID=3457661 RepID=UPI004034BF87
MNADTVYDTLDQALAENQIPSENHALLRAITEHLPIARYSRRSDGIRAERTDQGPPLTIYYGYTYGFASEEEAAAAAPGATRWPSSDSRRWGITHPVNHGGTKGGRASSTRSRTERPLALCPECFLAKPCYCDG